MSPRVESAGIAPGDEQRDAIASDTDALTAHVMSVYIGALGALVAVVSAFERWLAPSGAPGPNRLVFGTLLCVGALACARVARRGRPRLAVALLLGATLLALSLYAWEIGLGVHTTALSGVAVLVAVAGAAAGLRAASALALLYIAVAAALAWAEWRGLLPGRGLEATLPLQYRVVAHLLMALGGWLAALLLYRIVGGALRRAVDDRKLLAELLRIGSDWTWKLDERGHTVALSQSFEARSGRSVAEFLRIGQPGGPQIVPDAEWAALREDLEQRRAYRDRVITYRCADGTLLCVRGTGDPVYDALQRFVGWRGVGRNVTAEWLAQRAQRRTEALLDRLVQSSPDAICVARLDDGSIVMANPGFLALAGRPEPEVLGRSLQALGLWHDAAEPDRLRGILQGEGLVRDLPGVVRGADGGVRDVLLTAAAFEWDGSRVAVITTRDVTDTARARRESDAILDHASIGIALERDGRFERVNPQWATMFGDAAPALSGPVPGADGSSVERRIERPDGQAIVVRLRARPVKAAHPGQAATIWVAEDITLQRRNERELAEAKQQADAANAAKSAFLATMSHEIRTPLNGVVGLARMLQDEDLDAVRRRTYLAHLVDAADLLSGIVSDVLDLTKIEAGHLQLEDIEFELRPMLHGAFESFAWIGRERGLAMDCRIDAALPERVRGDPVRVRQILSNYLSNALKFTPCGSVSVQVSPGRAGRVRIAVRDSGPGVAPEEQARLFRPFMQADSSTTRRYGGTGLGLSICRQLATQMDGEVGVDSDGHSGSCFWAELRLQAVAGPDAGTALATPAPALPLAGSRVLVAEDNPVNMLIACAMLEKLGAEVLQAQDGEEALALAHDHAAALDAVLMDLHMPVVDGLEATRRLRAAAPTARLPVVALSAAVLEHERQQARAAGMDGFVAKPMFEAELLRVLLPLLRR